MGMSASKRVEAVLVNSSEFDSACDSAFSDCLSLTQHAFPGVLPYQLLDASALIYRTLSSHRFPLVVKWLRDPPSRCQVDSALRLVTRPTSQREGGGGDSGSELGPLGADRFKEWAVTLFADSIARNAEKALLIRVPFGIAGIAGIGALTRSKKDLVGAAISVYALGVATSIYMSLSG